MIEDYGCDPLGNDVYRLIPSGRIVTLEQMKAWNASRRKREVKNDCLGLSWDEIERKQGGKLKR